MNQFAKYIFVLGGLFSFGGAKAQSDFQRKLADSALTLTLVKVIYVPDYVIIPYPNGDVASNTGVCSDVVIRAYRKMGIDLQKEVHEDMKVNFKKYPKLWSLNSPDKNIDHRRVSNLMTFFKRFGSVLDITSNGLDYQPGDIVCWNLGGNITHIGLVSNILSDNKKEYLIIHNVGSGQVLEQFLFEYKIIGHFRYSKL